jgi:hypothetical protein
VAAASSGAHPGLVGAFMIASCDGKPVEDYVNALISGHLATEPLLLTHAAEALSSGSVTLPEEDADEFDELGRSVWLEELAEDSWDDLDPEDQRLIAITPA